MKKMSIGILIYYFLLFKGEAAVNLHDGSVLILVLWIPRDIKQKTSSIV